MKPVLSTRKTIMFDGTYITDGHILLHVSKARKLGLKLSNYQAHVDVNLPFAKSDVLTDGKLVYDKSECENHHRCIKKLIEGTTKPVTPLIVTEVIIEEKSSLYRLRLCLDLEGKKCHFYDNDSYGFLFNYVDGYIDGYAGNYLVDDEGRLQQWVDDTLVCMLTPFRLHNQYDNVLPIAESVLAVYSAKAEGV